MSLLVGVAGGIVVAVKVFAIEVDLLAIPYSNTSVKLTESISIEQGSISRMLPAGSEITFKYAPKGMPVYSLDIIGEYGGQLETIPLEQGNAP